LGLREKILPQRRRFRSFKVSRFRDSKYGDSLGAENARKICGEHSEKLLTAKGAKKSRKGRKERPERSFQVSRFAGAENTRKICGEHSEKLLTAKDAKKSIESRVASKAVKIGIHDRGDRKSRRRSGERVIGPFQPE
jgi:hypothetical protein